MSYGDKVAAEEIMVTCYSLLSGSDPAKIKPYQLERINSFAADLAMIGQKDLAKELLDELLRVVSFVEKSIQEPEKAGKLRDLKENIEWKIKNLFT